MKVSTLLFVLLVLFTQAGNAQTTKPSASEKAPVPVMRANSATNLIRNNSSDEEILQRADQIRYQALYQDYSNIANALADSKMDVSLRLPTLKRLSDTYFFKQPESVDLPSNLLKPDGSPMSDQEMSDFVNRLTKISMTTASAKSNTQDEMTDGCFARFFTEYYLPNPDLVIVEGWVILLPPYVNNIPECAGVPFFLPRPVDDIVANN